MTKNLSITTASEGDAPALVQYMTALVNEKLSVILHRDVPPTLDEEVAFIRNHTEDEGACLLVARLDGTVVGVLNFRLYQHSQMSHSGVLGMSVSKKFRHKGVGSQLIRALIDWATLHQVRRIELSVLSNNLAALRLYARLGFKVEGTQKGAVKIGATYLDKVLMCLSLSEQ